MHATFGIQSVQTWLERDNQRQCEGTPDSMAYLVESVRFLMTVAHLNLSFAKLCRDRKNDREALFQGLESNFALLRSFGMDTTVAKDQCRSLRLFAAQLAMCADSHEASVQEMTGLFDMLQDRVAAVMRPPGLVAQLSRAN